MSQVARQNAINEIYTRLVEGEKTPHLQVAKHLMFAGITMDEVDIALRNQLQHENEQHRNRQRRTR